MQNHENYDWHATDAELCESAEEGVMHWRDELANIADRGVKTVHPVIAVQKLNLRANGSIVVVMRVQSLRVRLDTGGWTTLRGFDAAVTIGAAGVTNIGRIHFGPLEQAITDRARSVAAQVSTLAKPIVGDAIHE